VAGPTTEVLNEDIKELKAEIRDIRGDLNVLKADVHNIALGLAELRAEVRVSLGVARWAGALLVTTILATASTGIWWASGLTGEVHSIETRFDKLETTIVKALNQGPPSQPAQKAEDEVGAPAKR